ncbi:MAG: hypothetical protein IKY12_06815, partial [Clostridia bacterium]|nr:hypothetical protein [Clostridia bacterium]
MKKIICLAILTIVLTVSAFAANISTADELLTLMHTESMWTGDYTLTDNINLADATLDLKQSPIGTEETPYSGVFDGAGYEISNINLSGDSRVALFGYAKGATIKNLTVSGNVTSTGTVTAGILACGRDEVTVEKCHNKCTVSGLQFVAGVVAYFRGSDNADVTEPKMVISECINSGTIIGLDTAQSDAGGIVGTTWGVGAVRNCLNIGLVTTGEVAPTRAYVGGICGRTYSYAYIYNCY